VSQEAELPRNPAVLPANGLPQAGVSAVHTRLEHAKPRRSSGTASAPGEIRTPDLRFRRRTRECRGASWSPRFRASSPTPHPFSVLQVIASFVFVCSPLTQTWPPVTLVSAPVQLVSWAPPPSVILTL
jgi:hypothetical protein